LFKSLLKGLLFDFDRLSYIISETYKEKSASYDNDELYDFTLASQNRSGEIRDFLANTFGSDYYTKELNRELDALIENVDMHSMSPESLNGFMGKEIAFRWNIFTATLDYVIQFLGDNGVDSAFFYKLYITTLKKYGINSLVMI